MTSTTDTTTTQQWPISADMAAVLTHEDDTIRTEWTKGNIAAHAFNVTQGGGLEGINLGWRDQEASTDFLVSLVDSVDEAWAEILEENADQKESDPGFPEWAWDRMRDNGRDFEMADSAIPVGTYQRITAALELGLQDGPDDSGLLPEAPSMFDIAVAALYELATSIIDGLMGLLIANAEVQS